MTGAGESIAEYLTTRSVVVEPYTGAVSIPVLPGWSEAAPDQFPGAAQVVACPASTSAGFTANAVLSQARLDGHFDVFDLLSCAFVDSRRLPFWCDIVTSRAPFGRAPSAFIRGTYVAGDWNLDVTTRYVITGNPADTWLTQLTVTTLADRGDELEADVAALNRGLRFRGQARVSAARGLADLDR
ncbi:LpqN/LpqT family lipoprotein [Rhodococcus gannanensis]|uniref:LpqN/LpqT family lipoprotein n=1 Tax=Rhodococcus gannanensis TaxID=1960308 RepID=A0ABW4P136_9NOCA